MAWVEYTEEEFERLQREGKVGKETDPYSTAPAKGDYYRQPAAPTAPSDSGPAAPAAEAAPARVAPPPPPPEVMGPYPETPGQRISRGVRDAATWVRENVAVPEEGLPDDVTRQANPDLNPQIGPVGQAISGGIERVASGSARTGRLLAGGAGEYSVHKWEQAAEAARQAGQEDAARALEERAESTRRTVESIRGDAPVGFTEKVISAVGRTPAELAEIAAPTKLLGAPLGFATHAVGSTVLDGGSPAEAAEQGAVGGITGKIVHDATRLLPPWARVGALGGLFAVPGYLEGRSLEDVAVDAFVGGGLGVMGGPGMPLGRRGRPAPGEARPELPPPEDVALDALRPPMAPERPAESRPLPPELATPAPEVPPALPPRAAPVPPAAPPVQPAPPVEPPRAPAPPPEVVPPPRVEPAQAPPPVAPPAAPRTGSAPVPDVEIPDARTRPPLAPGLGDYVVTKNRTEPKTGEPIAIDGFQGSGRTDQRSVYGEGANGPILGEAGYWALTRKDAEAFGPQVKQERVVLRNPFVISTGRQLADALGGPIPTENAARGEVFARLRRELEERGHDGVLVNIRGDEKRLFEVFGNSQAIVFRRPAPRSSGAEVNLSTGEKLPVRYGLVELDSLVPSNDPFTFAANPRYAMGQQQRDYGSPAEQTKVITGAQQFDAGRIYDTGASPLEGPPIVTPSGQVLGGNGRTMMMARAEQAKPGTLRAAAEAFGDRLGIDFRGAAQNLRRPVPVRIYGEEPTGRDAQELSARLNEAPGLEVGPTEFAVNAAKRLTDRSMGSILDSVNRSLEDSPSISDALRGNRDLVTALERDGILTPQNRARYVVLEGPERGTLNPDGRAMVARALLSRVLPDKDLQEAMEPSFRNRVARSVPSILALDAEFPEVGFAKQIRDVAQSEVSRRARGQTIQDFFAQQQLVGDVAPSQRNPELRRLHEFMIENGDRKVADAIGGYREAMAQGKSQAADLFGNAFEPADLPRVFFPTRAPEDAQALVRMGHETARAGMSADQLKGAGWKVVDRSPALEHKLYETITWRDAEGRSLVEFRPVEGWKKKSSYELPRVVAKDAAEQEAFHRALGAPQRGVRPPGRDPLEVEPSSPGVRAMAAPAAAGVLPKASGPPGPLHIGLRDVDASSPGAKTPRQLRRRGQMIVDVARAFGIPVQTGRKFYVRLPKNVLGYFKHSGSSTGELRLMTWGDFQVFAHELNHYLTDFKTRAGKFAFPGFRAIGHTKDKALQDELRSISYDDQSVTEGAAEGFRLWLTQPAELAKRAPLAMRAFDEAVHNLPRKQRRALHDFREQSAEFFAQGGRGELRAQIGPDGLPLESVLESAFDRMRQRHLDDLHSYLRAERIAEGAQQKDGITEVARRGRAIQTVAEGIYKFGAPVWTDVKNNGVSYTGKGIREILAPVARSAGRLADFFDYAIARQAKEIEGFGVRSGFTKQAIKDGEAIAREKGNEHYEKVFEELVQFQRQVADFAQEAGLFTEAGRKLWRRKEYAFGFFRQMQDARRGMGQDLAGGLEAPRAVRRMKGSGRNLRDPLENLLVGPRNLIMAAMENRIRAKVADFLEKPGGGMFGRYVGPQDERVTFATKRVKDYVAAEMQKQGLSKAEIDALNFGEADVPFAELWFPGKPKLDNLMTVLVNGKPKYYEVFDRSLADSIAAMRRPMPSGGMKAMNELRRLSQKTITLAVDFIARNAVRDPIMASVMSRTGWQHITDAWKGIIEAWRESPAYKDFVANGGGGGTLFDGPKGFKRDLHRYARRKGLDPRTLIDPFDPRGLVDFFERLGHATEMGPRLAEYKRAVRKGESETHAAFLGREVSTDFSVRGSGEMVNFLSNTVPFFNAMMASTDRFYRGLVTDPDYKAKTAMRVGVYALASMALHAYNRGLDEYNDLPDWAKESYMHFPIPQGLDENGKMKHDFARLPRIWEVGAIGRASELLVDGFMGRADTGSEDEGIGWALIGTLLSNFNITPPPGLLPLIEQATNRTWFTGSPIVPMGEQQEEAWSQTTSSTPRVLEEYGRAVRNAPLPDFLKSPARVDALLRGIFNHFATYGLTAADRLFFNEGPEKHTDELPVARSFYARGGKYNRVVDQFYETLETATRASTTFRDMMNEGRTEIVEEMRSNPDVYLAKGLAKANKQVQGMNKQREVIERDESLSPAEKRDAIDQLVAERNEFMRRTLEDYERRRESFGGTP